MERTFTCEQCGYENAFDPADWLWVLVARPDDQGGIVKFLYHLVRCGECSREQRVPVERE